MAYSPATTRSTIFLWPKSPIMRKKNQRWSQGLGPEAGQRSVYREAHNNTFRVRKQEADCPQKLFKLSGISLASGTDFLRS